MFGKISEDAWPIIPMMVLAGGKNKRVNAVFLGSVSMALLDGSLAVEMPSIDFCALEVSGPAPFAPELPHLDILTSDTWPRGAPGFSML